MKANTVRVNEAPHVGFIRLVRPTHCPGYYLTTNSQGFTWKQRCNCCPAKPLIRYLQSELQNRSHGHN